MPETVSGDTTSRVGRVIPSSFVPKFYPLHLAVLNVHYVDICFLYVVLFWFRILFNKFIGLRSFRRSYFLITCFYMLSVSVFYL